MRVPNTEHTSRAWRIHEIAQDFRLEDVWALPGLGGPDDFRRLVERVAAYDPWRSRSRATRALFAVRRKLGEVLGWDDADVSDAARTSMLDDRLPADLRDGPGGPAFSVLPFTSLYLTDDEWAAEGANRTVHGVLHLGRVRDASGLFRAQLAIYVKPNGLLGRAYLAAIKPFRYLIVYPSVMKELGRAWGGAHVATAKGAGR